MDYGLSNLSFIFITVTFYTMIKSIIPILIMINLILFGLLKLNIKLLLSVSLITIGIFLTVFGSVDLNIFGVVLVVIGCFIQSIRLTLLELYLKKEKFNTLMVLCYVSLISSFTVFPFAFFIEFYKIFLFFSKFQFLGIFL
jgi:solute carrier family 35, member C2